MAELAIPVVLLLASSVLWGTAIAAWVRIRAPTVNSFAIIAAGMGTGGGILAVGYLLESRLLILTTTSLLGMLLPVLWFWFTVEYVGREEFTAPRNIALIVTPVILGVIATVVIYGALVVPWIDLPRVDAVSGPLLIGLTTVNMLQWFGLLYAGGLVLAGSGVVLWAFQRYQHLDSTTGVLLGTFGAVPWLSLLFGLQLEGLSILVLGGTVSVGLLVGGIAAVGLVGPYPLFARVPSAGNIGPRTVIEELNDHVIVTDREGTIVELNASARAAFERSDAVIGVSLDAFLGVSVSALQDVDIIDLETTNGRVLFDPTISPLSDPHGQLLGYGVVLRDMTAETTRRQLLEVLNRVLRHNLRNEMNIILGSAEVIHSRTDNPATIENAAAITTYAEGLSELSEKVRDAERVLDVDVTASWETSLKPLVEATFDGIETDRDPAFQYRGPETVVVNAPEEMLELLLLNLVQNAILHNERDTPAVDVEVEQTSDPTYPIRISIIDDGPGIPAEERQVIEQGIETQLEHGSGLGLWIVRLATMKLGGKLEFDEQEPTGTIVSIHLPRRDQTASTAPGDRATASITPR